VGKKIAGISDDIPQEGKIIISEKGGGVLDF
jgi:hypothetical protein